MLRFLTFISAIFLYLSLSAQGEWVPSSSEARFHPEEGLPWFMKDGRPDSLDILHYDVRLGPSNREKKRLEGSCGIRAAVLEDDIEAFPFDLAGFQVRKAELEGEGVEHRRRGDTLWVQFPSPLSKGDTIELSVDYGGKPVIDPSGWGGTYFRNGYVFNLGVGFRAKPHSYGRTWFPCVDHYRERAKYRFRVVAPEGEKAVCSGTLQEVTPTEGGKAWLWKLEQEVPPYLVSFAIGELSTLHWEYESQSGRSIPIRLDVPPEDSGKAVKSFAHLKDALSTFEERFGSYRWPRVGYVAVPFPNGAMEHATNIAYPKASVNGTHRSDDLMAHELAHAWWGNLVTCATPWDMWINEGMASFSEFLFAEGLEGKAAYRELVRKNHRSVLRSAHLQDGNQHRAVYGIPHAYTYGAHVYDKGADVLRSFRSMMADSLFFPPLRQILEEHAYSNMPTHRLLEEWQKANGKPMESWGADWLQKPGFPHFQVEVKERERTAEGHKVELLLEQRATHASSPYRMVPLDLLLKGPDGKEAIRRVRSTGKRDSFSFQVPFDPVHVSADPGGDLAQAMLTDTGQIDIGGVHVFDHTEAKLEVEEGTEDFYIQMRQHYIEPDTDDLADSLRISKTRFWSIDGTYPSDTSLKISFRLDGQQKKGVHPEIHFMDEMERIDEEKLLVLHRPLGENEWHRCSHCRILSGDSPTDGKARFSISKGLKGDFALAAPSRE